MSADLFYHGFFFLSFFFRRLISELAKRNSTKIGDMFGSKCVFKTHVQNLGYPSRYKSGVQKQPFWITSQLNINFNGLCLRNETWYRHSVKCVDNYEGSSTSTRNVMNFGLQTASNWKWTTFIIVCGKYIPDNKYKILSESAWFRRRCDKKHLVFCVRSCNSCSLRKHEC